MWHLMLHLHRNCTFSQDQTKERLEHFQILFIGRWQPHQIWLKGPSARPVGFIPMQKACCWLAQPDLPTSLDLILRLKSNSSQDDDEGHKSASGLHNILNLIDLLNSEKGFTHCRPTVDFSTLAPEKWRNFPRIIMAFTVFWLLRLMLLSLHEGLSQMTNSFIEIILTLTLLCYPFVIS